MSSNALNLGKSGIDFLAAGFFRFFNVGITIGSHSSDDVGDVNTSVIVSAVSG